MTGDDGDSSAMRSGESRLVRCDDDRHLTAETETPPADPPSPPAAAASLRFSTWVGHVPTIKPLWEKSQQSPEPQVQDCFLSRGQNKCFLFSVSLHLKVSIDLQKVQRQTPRRERKSRMQQAPR